MGRRLVGRCAAGTACGPCDTGRDGGGTSGADVAARPGGQTAGTAVATLATRAAMQNRPGNGSPADASSRPEAQRRAVRDRVASN
ncbi:hypothetical protein PP713_04440 [Mycobacterium sp. CSUR Q5927]|nr:hypothetical protein [Mycobacterium sp. CSUR Q5927]